MTKVNIKQFTAGDLSLEFYNSINYTHRVGLNSYSELRLSDNYVTESICGERLRYDRSEMNTIIEYLKVQTPAYPKLKSLSNTNLINVSGRSVEHRIDRYQFSCLGPTLIRPMPQIYSEINKHTASLTRVSRTSIAKPIITACHESCRGSN